MATLFENNPRRRDVGIDDRALVAFCEETAARFSELPLHHAGESTEVRRTSVPGLLAQRLKPSLNSITERRKGAIEGTDRLRLDISCVFYRALHARGISTCHLARHGDDLVVTEERIPPIEVIVKAAMIGTPSRVYDGIFERVDRFGQRFERRQAHAPYVRFDYRNPLQSASGALLRDECMPLALADRFIDTERATESALAVFDVVRTTLRALDLDLDVLDACFLFDETGRVLCYELSPDNMRVKRTGWASDPKPTDEFDKDLWRNRVDDEALTEQWRALRDALGRPER